MAEITLRSGEICLVDDDDFDMLSKFTWYVLKRKHTSYARAPLRGPDRSWRELKMHRLIMNCPQDFVVDHIDGNGLNNQKSNLRVCTFAENRRNTQSRRIATGGIKGAIQRSGSKTWASTITFQGKSFYLGRFPTMEEAARAYDAAARNFFGEFARLNYPDD